MFWLMMFACTSDPGPQTLSGQLKVGPYEGEGLVSEGTITLLGDDLSVIDTQEVASDGSFELTGPAGSVVVAVVEGPGFVESWFPGRVGAGPTELTTGELFAWPESSDEAFVMPFGACAQDGPRVLGEIRFLNLEDDTGVHPVAETGYASLYDLDGEWVADACYLDDAGAYDPASYDTGATGRFAFFGIDPGVYTMTYGFRIAADDIVEQEVWLAVPESGAAPLFAAWTEFPL